MRDTVEDGTTGWEACTVRFLIEQQLRVIDDLDRRGLDGHAAQDLLRRLMRRDEDLRRVVPPPPPFRIARRPAV